MLHASTRARWIVCLSLLAALTGCPPQQNGGDGNGNGNGNGNSMANGNRAGQGRSRRRRGHGKRSN